MDDDHLIADNPRELYEVELLEAIFRGKWRRHVLVHLVNAPARLSELRRLIPESSKKMLIDTLHGLEKTGIVERDDRSTPHRKVVIYSLRERYRHPISALLGITA